MRKYLALFQLSFNRTLGNTKALFGLSLFLIVCLLVFANLWKVIAARAGVDSYSASELLWYIALNEWVLISIPHIHDQIEQDLHSGTLAYQLPRPISYIYSVLADGMGILVAHMVVLGGVSALFVYFQVGLPPIALWKMLMLFPLGILSGLVGILFLMMIGVSAFWLHETEPFYWIWEKLLFMFGGLILPLAVYPKWMQQVASFTPFPFILGGRSGLIFNFTLHSLGEFFLQFALFGGIAVLAIKWLYGRSLKVLVIEGG
ncbi:MAG: hypothetical protein S4CHLAM102_07180 [Chlamydiia bacterium]|nr:hypothetical protein [Chlamydiia bacterium]